MDQAGCLRNCVSEETPVRIQTSRFGMRRLSGRLLTLVAVISVAAPVLMHGNTDAPDGTIAPLAAVMEDAGYLVERPEMC